MFEVLVASNSWAKDYHQTFGALLVSFLYFHHYNEKPDTVIISPQRNFFSRLTCFGLPASATCCLKTEKLLTNILDL